MSTIIVVLLTLVFSYLINKDILKLSALWREVSKAGLAFLGAVFLGLNLWTLIGMYFGVNVAYLLVKNKLMGSRFYDVDKESLLGEYIFEEYGENACRWLFYAEVFVYLLTVFINGI